MRITELYGRGRLPISFEIFPPKGELDELALDGMLGELAATRPDYISVTYSAGGSGNSDRSARIAGKIQNEYGICAMAHLTCINSLRAEVDEAVRQFHQQGIQNVLALRGDRIPDRQATDFGFAWELVAYLKKTTDFTLAGACYPESHVACDSLDVSIEHLRQKQDAGLDFLITQLFFDNTCYYRFLEKARTRGITLPIDVGIMPILTKASLTKMVFGCGASLPAAAVRMVYKYQDDPESLRRAGVDYAAAQILDLAANGVDGIHIYVMNKPDVARTLTAALHDAGY